MSPAALPYVLLIGLLFGSSLIVSRYSVSQFAPTTFVWLRSAISLSAFAVVYGLGRRRPTPDRALLRDGVALGVFGTAVPMVGYIASLRYQSAGMTALLITVAPAVTVLMAHFLLPDERLSPRRGRASPWRWPGRRCRWRRRSSPRCRCCGWGSICRP